MATQPTAKPLNSLEDSLKSDFQPDRDLKDCVIKKRNLGEFDRAFLQTLLADGRNNHNAD